MGTTAGSLNPVERPDTLKAIASFGVVVPANGAAQVVNPRAAVNAFTVFNTSLKWVRGAVTFAAGITDADPATPDVFLVPPLGTASFDFESNSALSGDVPAIESISFDVIAAPTATGVASDYAALAANADAVFSVNFGQK